jgi:hypothetical protein
MFLRSSCITALTIVMALSGIAGASAATSAGHAGAASPVRLQASKAMKLTRTKGIGPVKPLPTGGTTVVAITAFPTGGKGSGTEATCGLWADRLQEDEAAQDAATDKQDIIDATENLNEDVDNALDAGCVVIYSAARSQVTTGQVTTVKTVAVAKMRSGGFTSSTWTAGPSVAMISAFPTGGKGSGTEATCALWSQRLQDDQRIIDDAPETDKDDASGPLNEDVDNALDAGCAVIY